MKEIFLVLIRKKQTKKEFEVLEKKNRPNKNFERRIFFHKNIHHLFVVKLHTHLNTRAERERGDDDADDGAYYYYFYSFR